MNQIKIPALCGLFAWSFRAVAQDPSATVAAVAAVDPTTAMMVSLLDSGGLPLVCAFIAWKLSGAVNGWTPTIKVIHERQEAPPWDGVERRRGGDSDR